MPPNVQITKGEESRQLDHFDCDRRFACLIQAFHEIQETGPILVVAERDLVDLHRSAERVKALCDS